MNRTFVYVRVFTCLGFVLVATLSTQAATVPFKEEFANPDEVATGWVNSDESAFLTHVGSGGPDGGTYASTTFAFSTGGGFGPAAVVFRGQDEYGFSGGAFEGNWVTDGVRRVSAYVRHDAPEPLTYFLRVSAAINFPGAGIEFAPPVQPNVWTELTFDVSPGSPDLVPEGPFTWSSIFSSIGHVQFGVNIPASLEEDDTPYTFDLDKVTITTPEPASLAGAWFALAALAWSLQKRQVRRGVFQK